jgi:hypothetical protein
MCFSPPPDPRGSARAAPPLATARDARARRAPFPRILDAARAPGRRAFSPPRPRPDRAATVASKPSSHADPRRSVSFLRSTDARLRSTAGEPPSLTVSSSFRSFSTRFHSVYITACNIKKLDVKFYNIERPRCWVTVSHGDKKYTTKVGIGLDPEWEEETFFEIADPETDKIGAEFFIKCEKNGNEQMLGDAQSYALNKLLKGKQTYKGLVVPGGKADMMFTAVDFGDEEAAEEDDAFMDFL